MLCVRLALAAALDENRLHPPPEGPALVRIGIVSPALHVQSGYGIQARHLATRLAKDGHEVAIFAISGLIGGVLNIGGFPHYPGGRLMYNRDVLERHAQHWGTEVLITLCDLMHQDSETIARLRAAGVQVIHWTVVDCEPLSAIDEAVLRYGGGTPVAMSRFGQRMLKDAGIDAGYVPHCVDTNTFIPLPPEIRAEMRADQGLTGKFTVAMAAANADLCRKGFFELYHAFAAFHGKHPASALLMHSEADGSFSHADAIGQLHLEAAVIFTDDYLIKTGQLDSAYMAAWYNLADVYAAPSWAEGFGVTTIEAGACGLPVIGTDCSALTERLARGVDWRVPGELKANPLHKRAWRSPWIAGIEQALVKAHTAWKGPAWPVRQRKARENAEAYDADVVYESCWRPLLASLEPGTGYVSAGGLKWRRGDAGFQFGDRLALDHESALEPEVFKGLPADGVFVDVGAHVGHWALRAARRCARVIAVEANPGTAKRLQENIALNELGNVEVHNVAAWDEYVQLYVHNHHGGAEHDGTDQVSAEVSDTPVETSRLDVLLGGEPRIDVIKIDVEGADLHVLRGLEDLLARLRPRLFIEDHSVYGMYEKAELSDLLGSFGYRWRDVTLGYTEAVPREPVDSDDTPK